MDIATNIFFIDMVFQARQVIRSVPPFHGARWSAFFRYVCRQGKIPMEQAILGILPFRSGRRLIQKGESMQIRLLCSDFGVAILNDLVENIRNLPTYGEFDAKRLQLLDIRDGLNDRNGIKSTIPETFTKFDIAHCVDECTHLAACSQWHIVFYCPLRLKCPSTKDTPSFEKMFFCTADFFRQIPYASQHLLSHVRYVEHPDASYGFTIQSDSLSWVDMRYSRDRKIALGGLYGELLCEGSLSRDAATLLVLGQYLGCGKNPRFGLGWWRIPELDPVRNIHLPGD